MDPSSSSFFAALVSFVASLFVGGYAGAMARETFQAVIFDMDGTIIEPLLDFTAIREELGIAPQDGILEALDAMEPEQARDAHAKLLAHELSAARSAALMPGVREVLSAVAGAGLKTALLTRNAREAMETVLDRHGLTFDLAWPREMGPIKPEPDGILRACEQLGVGPARTACVGDFHYDILAANAAGALSVLCVPSGARPEYADEADRVIVRLDELPHVLGL